MSDDITTALAALHCPERRQEGTADGSDEPSEYLVCAHCTALLEERLPDDGPVVEVPWPCETAVAAGLDRFGAPGGLRARRSERRHARLQGDTVQWLRRELTAAEAEVERLRAALDEMEQQRDIADDVIATTKNLLTRRTGTLKARVERLRDERDRLTEQVRQAIQAAEDRAAKIEFNDAFERGQATGLRALAAGLRSALHDGEAGS